MKNVLLKKWIVSVINKAKKLKEFKGEKDDEVILYNPPGVNAERVILLGLGKTKEIDFEKLRKMSGIAVKIFRRY